MRPVPEGPLIAGRAVWPIGLGGASWSLGPEIDDARSIATVHAALDAGIQLIDTARAYTTESEPAHNERLIARALAGRTERPVIATKGGHFRIDRDTWGIDASPAALRWDCEASLRALAVDVIDLYFLHKPDPDVPLAESVGALHELREAGLVAHVGLSNVSAQQLGESMEITRIDAVQNHLAVFGAHVDDDVVALCEQRSIPFIAYSPLLGILDAGSAFADRARAAGISAHRLALAWLVRRSPDIIPIVGATRPESAVDSAAAPGVQLPEAEWAEVARIVAESRARAPIVGNVTSAQHPNEPSSNCAATRYRGKSGVSRTVEQPFCDPTLDGTR